MSEKECDCTGAWSIKTKLTSNPNELRRVRTVDLCFLRALARVVAARYLGFSNGGADVRSRLTGYGRIQILASRTPAIRGWCMVGCAARETWCLPASVIG